MKKIWKKLRKKSVEAFTLVEMLIVLLIIGVLMLLFVPNLSSKKRLCMKKEMLLLSKLSKVRWSFMK